MSDTLKSGELAAKEDQPHLKTWAHMEGLHRKIQAQEMKIEHLREARRKLRDQYRSHQRKVEKESKSANQEIEELQAAMSDMAKDLMIQAEVNGYIVSTSDLRWSSYACCETMVFAGRMGSWYPAELLCRRYYGSWSQAREGHKAVVELVKAAPPPPWWWKGAYRVYRSLEPLRKELDRQFMREVGEWFDKEDRGEEVGPRPKRPLALRWVQRVHWALRKIITLPNIPEEEV